MKVRPSAESFLTLVCVVVVVVAEKSRAFSPHGDAKKQQLGPDDLRTTNLGRQVLSPYPMSPRDMAKISHNQHQLHFNCECSSPERASDLTCVKYL